MSFNPDAPLTVEPKRLARAESPVSKARDLAYLRFAKPDLEAQEAFLQDFGLVTAERTQDRLYMRGAGPAPFCLDITKGNRPAFLGFGFEMTSRAELEALAAHDSQPIEPIDGPGGGERVRLTDPNGFAVDAVFCRAPAELRSVRQAAQHNTPFEKTRINRGQRGPFTPPDVVRLGHLVLETPDFEGSMAWYQERFGLVPTDVLCLKDGSPAIAFNRCDRGEEPADHHTLVIASFPTRGYNHSAYEVSDLDAVGLGQQVMKQKGHSHAWGIGRHILGSQIFDYWSDADGHKFEHFADGDVFTADYETGYHPLTASGLYQWGTDLPADFVRPRLTPNFIFQLIGNLRTVPAFTLARLKLLLSSAGGKARPWL